VPLMSSDTHFQSLIFFNFLPASQLPQTPHFQKQLLGQNADKVERPSFLDHIETLSPADLLALEVRALAL
jgi:hypothetical protein